MCQRSAVENAKLRENDKKTSLNSHSNVIHERISNVIVPGKKRFVSLV